MGQGSAALLPRLDGVTAEHRICGEDRRAIILARTLTTLGIADAGDWKCSVSGYLLETLNRWIALHGGDVAREQFSLNAMLTNIVNRYGSGDVDPERLYLTVEADAAGYIVIGPTLDTLKLVHPQLPVTFYRLVTGAIRRWLRVYDYDDALGRVEMWKEWIEQEENADEYEIPDVAGCIPAELKQEPLKTEELHDLIGRFDDEDVRRLILGALHLDAVSHKLQPSEISDEAREAFMDSNPPLPALLVSFRRYDAVVAAFDEESQEMLEAEPEPSFLAEINPADPESVRHEFDSLAALCETLEAANRLARLLPGNQEEG